MKIYFNSIYKETKNTLGFWYLIKPQIKRCWNKKLIHVGTRGFYMVIDLRGIDSIQDFTDALGHPNTWYILKKFKKRK